MICVGLIGNGKISDTHKEAYARMDGVSLEVYCDANPANLVGIEGARSSRERGSSCKLTPQNTRGLCYG